RLLAEGVPFAVKRESLVIDARGRHVHHELRAGFSCTSLALRGRKLVCGNARRDALVTARAFGPKVVGTEAAPAAFEHRVQLGSAHIDKQTVLERRALGRKVRARARSLVKHLKKTRHRRK